MFHNQINSSSIGIASFCWLFMFIFSPLICLHFQLISLNQCWNTTQRICPWYVMFHHFSTFQQVSTLRQSEETFTVFSCCEPLLSFSLISTVRVAAESQVVWLVQLINKQQVQVQWAGLVWPGCTGWGAVAVAASGLQLLSVFLPQYVTQHIF